jgi:septal ring factor EnvC (AmiA/AmiB activator)
MADTLANMTIDDEVAHFLEQCANAAKLHVSAETAPKLRTLQGEELKLRKRLDAARVEEKAPHMEAARSVDARYQPMISQVQDAVKAVTRALTAYLEAEEAKARAAAAAARKAAEEEQRRAAELAAQAQAEEDPFEAFDTGEAARKAEAEAAALARQAAAPVKVNVTSTDGGKAAGLRTVGWIVEVDDPSALVAHYADRIEFLELAKKCAAADAKASKGQAKIPGCKFIADRRAI